MEDQFWVGLLIGFLFWPVALSVGLVAAAVVKLRNQRKPDKPGAVPEDVR